MRDADIILHIIDITHPYFEDQIAVVEQTLKDLGSDQIPQMKIFNKVDALTDRNRIPYVKNKYPESIILSAQRGINISQLKEKLVEITEAAYIVADINLGLHESKKVAKIHTMAEVISTDYNDESIHVKYRANKENSEKIKKMLSRV